MQIQLLTAPLQEVPEAAAQADIIVVIPPSGKGYLVGVHETHAEPNLARDGSIELQNM
jgi:hypothetical protein